MIDRYSFGRMVIAGQEYCRDLLLLPDGRILFPWWRENGHRLTAGDLAELIVARPMVIVAGTGASGLMKAAPDLKRELAAQGMELITRPTAEATAIYNQLCRQGKNMGGAFHLTC